MPSVITQFYQCEDGEVVAIVALYEEGVSCEKLVRHIQSFKISTEALLEDALTGFLGFPNYDPSHFDGKNLNSVFFDEQDGEFCYPELIAEIANYTGFLSTEYYFENMNKASIELLLPLKQITDKIEGDQLKTCVQ